MDRSGRTIIDDLVEPVRFHVVDMRRELRHNDAYKAVAMFTYFERVSSYMVHNTKLAARIFDIIMIACGPHAMLIEYRMRRDGTKFVEVWSDDPRDDESSTGDHRVDASWDQ